MKTSTRFYSRAHIIPSSKKGSKNFCSRHISVVAQGEIVAASLEDYLRRHPEIEKQLEKNSTADFCTTDSVEDFEEPCNHFLRPRSTVEAV
jgi:glutamate racemase